ncbi:hypothetical protein GCM10009559_07480 [Pseudonocardia zijingensis]|uniref:Uncharacterized protein n=1 Tax=Pseudonocardia zijingensis TaxID=153376 RepID=A0ABN1P6M6_9PSEU
MLIFSVVKVRDVVGRRGGVLGRQRAVHREQLGIIGYSLALDCAQRRQPGPQSFRREFGTVGDLGEPGECQAESAAGDSLTQLALRPEVCTELLPTASGECSSRGTVLPVGVLLTSEGGRSRYRAGQAAPVAAASAPDWPSGAWRATCRDHLRLMATPGPAPTG